MPQELPGFYYDEEKNRYFPIKGPIPGASTHRPKKPPLQENSVCKRKRINTSKLLKDRELYGNITNFNRRKCNFQEECHKMQVIRPVIRQYHGTQEMADGDLEHLCVTSLSPEGEHNAEALLAGGVRQTLSFLEVEKVEWHSDFLASARYMPDHLWPPNTENQNEDKKTLGYSLKAADTVFLGSYISCIIAAAKQSRTTYDGYSTQHALITTMGSGKNDGSLYHLNLTEPLDLNLRGALMRRICHVASFGCTIWTADCNSDQSEAVIGTSDGAALVNLETQGSSSICRSKSDIFAVQLQQSRNVVLCGLRNGAIVTVDIRQKEVASSRLARYQIPCTAQNSHELAKRPYQSSSRKWFELKGCIHPSQTIIMPSSITSLVSLQHYDQYFLASSMDGRIQLYDHRQTKKGPVQSYEGNVNSHTRLQLGVDPTERFVMSGGQDNKLRIWSIKSGELLFEDKISDSTIENVSWPIRRHLMLEGERGTNEEFLGQKKHDCGAWLGSPDGLYHMQWS